MPLFFKSVSRFLGGGSAKKKQSSKSSNSNEPSTTRYNNHDYDELEDEDNAADERYILDGRQLDYAVDANHDDNDDDDDDATNSSRYHLSKDIPSREETTSSVSSTEDDGEADDANANANEKEVEEPSPAETNSSSPSTVTNNNDNDNNNTTSTIDDGDDNNDLSFVGYEQGEEKKNDDDDDDDKLVDSEGGMASRTSALASAAIIITTATDDSHNKNIFRRRNSTKIKHEVTSHLGSYWEVAKKEKEEEKESATKSISSAATAAAGTNNDNDNDHDHANIHDGDGCSSRMTRSRSRQLSKEIKHEHNTNNNMMIMMPPSMMMNKTSNSTAALSPRHTSPYDDKNGGDDDNLTVMSGLTEITNHWNSSTTATATTVVGYSGSEHQLLPTTPTCDRSRSGGSMTSFGGCSRNSSSAKKMEDFLKSETESIRQLLLPTIESSSTTTSSSTKNSSNTTPKHRRLERTYSESSLVADESSRAATEAEAMAKDMERVLIEEFSTTEPTTTTTTTTLLYHNNDDAANTPSSSVSSSSPSFAAKGINTTVVRSSFGSSSEILTGADILSTMHPKQTPPSPLPLLISPLEKRQQTRIDNDDGINNKRRLHRRVGRYLSSWIKAIFVSVFVINSIMVTIGCSGVFVRNWGVTYNFELNNLHNAVQDSKGHVVEGMILTTKIVSTTKYYYIDEQIPEKYIPKLHEATRRSIEVFQTTKVYMQAQIVPMVVQTAHRSLESALATKSYMIKNYYCVPPLWMDEEGRRGLRKSLGQLPSVAASYLTLTNETKSTVLNRMTKSQSYMQDMFTSIKVVTVPTITTIVQDTKAYIFQSISHATTNNNTVYGASFTSLRANLYSYLVDRYEYTFTDRLEQETRIEEERKLQALLAEATAKAATQAKEETQHQLMMTAAVASAAAFLGSVATNYLFV